MIVESNDIELALESGSSGAIPKMQDETLSRKNILMGKTIGISISESDNLNELGYSLTHLKDVIIETTRHILVAGGKVAYGGDMRSGGFTELFFDLLAYYQPDKEILPNERVYSYLAYPISANLSLEKEAELRQKVSFKRIDPPEDLRIADTKIFLKPNSPENLYVWTRCLTKMREEMTLECDAHIFIGGRTKGFKGKCPGILEEFLLAHQQKHPIYLVGAFGGVTKDIIDSLTGKHPDSFTNEYYFDNSDYQKMIDIYNGKHPSNLIDYGKYLALFSSIGLTGIESLNGLSERDNLRLTKTPHINEIIYLILKGLTEKFT